MRRAIVEDPGNTRRCFSFKSGKHESPLLSEVFKTLRHLAALQGSGISQALWGIRFLAGGLQVLNLRCEPWKLN